MIVTNQIQNIPKTTTIDVENIFTNAGGTMTGNLEVPTISHNGKTFNVENLSVLGGNGKLWRAITAADNVEYINNKGYPIMISVMGIATIAGTAGSRITISVDGRDIGRILSNVNVNAQQSFEFIVPDGSSWKIVRNVANSSTFTATELS